MFYTYLRGLVMLIFMVDQWKCLTFTIRKKNSKFRWKLYPCSPTPYLVGSSLHGLCDQTGTNLFYGQKEPLSNRIFGWWIRMCGAFPIDWDNPYASAIKYPINVLKKVIVHWLCFQAVVVIPMMLRGGVALIAKMAKVRIMPVTYWP